jgi:cell division protein FtsB
VARPHIYRQQAKKNAELKAKIAKLKEAEELIAKIYSDTLGN